MQEISARVRKDWFCAEDRGRVGVKLKLKFSFRLRVRTKSQVIFLRMMFKARVK